MKKIFILVTIALICLINQTNAQRNKSFSLYGGNFERYNGLTDFDERTIAESQKIAKQYSIKYQKTIKKNQPINTSSVFFLHRYDYEDETGGYLFYRYDKKYNNIYQFDYFYYNDITQILSDTIPNGVYSITSIHHDEFRIVNLSTNKELIFKRSHDINHYGYFTFVNCHYEENEKFLLIKY